MRLLDCIALVLLAFAGTTNARGSDDIDVSTTIVQTVPLAKGKTVVVHCFCPKREVRHDAERKDVQLTIHGHLDSVGYHGKQEQPAAIQRERLEFSVADDGATLALTSREQAFMHHALVDDAVEIDAPADVDVQWAVLTLKDLQDRKID